MLNSERHLRAEADYRREILNRGSGPDSYDELPARLRRDRGRGKAGVPVTWRGSFLRRIQIPARVTGSRLRRAKHA